MSNNSHKQTLMYNKELKENKYSLLKDMSYTKIFAGNILVFSLANINRQISPAYRNPICLQKTRRVLVSGNSF